MSLKYGNGKSEPLDKFHSAILCGTHGHLSRLSVEVIDGALVVEARAATYHTVQLALAAIEAFTADYPKLTPAKISIRVNGQQLAVKNPHACVCEEP